MTGFSIIIPFKNEKENLDELLNSLLAQKTKNDFEIILIDDNSDDGGCEIVENFRRDTACRVRDLKNTACYARDLKNIETNGFGTPNPYIRLFYRKDFLDNSNISSKQNALDIGASQAKYDYLIFTDADMIFDENWLQNYADNLPADFVFGRTEICVGANIISPLIQNKIIGGRIIQKTQLDFLFAISFLFNKLGFDGSAMGNNLLISKKLYEKIGGQQGIGFSLIEDKKLLSAARKNGAKISCTKDFSAFAFTKPVSAERFLHQMIRWIKGGFVESKTLAFVLVVFAVSSLLIFPSFLLILLLIPIYLKNKISLKFAFLLPFVFFVETIVLLPSLFFVRLKWKNIKI